MRGPSLDPWTWTAERERAAELVADGHLTNDEIAAECDVEARTIQYWKRAPEFRERVHEHLAVWRAKLSQEGLALKSNRIAMLMGRAASIRGIVRARGKLPSHANAPGTTIAQKGLQVRTLKSIGGGDHQQVIEEFAIDTVTLADERDCLQAIATELGEWKQEIRVTTDSPISDEAKDLAELFTHDELVRARQRALERKPDAPPTIAPELPAPACPVSPTPPASVS